MKRSSVVEVSSPYPVTHGSVTAHARHSLPFSAAMVHLRDDVFVAMATRAFGDVVVARRDAQRIGIASGREIEGVPEPVRRLRRVFADERMWRVTVVADGNLTVTGLHPRREVLLHDVAVGARRGIVGEIRRAPRIPERERAQAENDADEDDERELEAHGVV